MTGAPIERASFDYAAVTPHKAETAREAAKFIRDTYFKVALGIIEIGEKLIAIKRLMPKLSNSILEKT